MGNLLRWPFTHITDLLETFERYKIPEQVLLKLREDPVFAKKVSDLLMEELKKNPGPMFTFNFDQTLTRKQMNERLTISDSVYVLKNEIVQSFLPITNYPDAGQQFSPPDAKPTVQMDAYLVQLYQETDEDEAVEILAELGLESLNTEEALSLVYLCRNRGFWQSAYDHRVIILGAKSPAVSVKDSHDNPLLIRPGFLSFGVSVDGHRLMNLEDNPHFTATDQFLVKRKKPQSETTET